MGTSIDASDPKESSNDIEKIDISKYQFSHATTKASTGQVLKLADAKLIMNNLECVTVNTSMVPFRHVSASCWSIWGRVWLA